MELIGTINQLLKMGKGNNKIYVLLDAYNSKNVRLLLMIMQGKTKQIVFAYCIMSNSIKLALGIQIMIV